MPTFVLMIIYYEYVYVYIYMHTYDDYICFIFVGFCRVLPGITFWDFVHPFVQFLVPELPVAVLEPCLVCGLMRSNWVRSTDMPISKKDGMLSGPVMLRNENLTFGMLRVCGVNFGTFSSKIGRLFLA